MHERVIDALKISICNVTRIKTKNRKNRSITTPGQSHIVPKLNSNEVSDTVKGAISYNI